MLTALTFGLYLKPWITIRYPEVPPSVGRFRGREARSVEAAMPNPAFQNYAAGGRLLGARLVARFHAGGRRGDRRQGRASDPAATAYVTKVDRAPAQGPETWLNAVTPLVGGRSSTAAACGSDERGGRRRRGRPAEAYTARWFAWDNAAGTASPSVAWSSWPVRPIWLCRCPSPSPAGEAGEPVGDVTGEHPAHPGWAAHPVTFSFRRTPGGWKRSGISREPLQEDGR